VEVDEVDETGDDVILAKAPCGFEALIKKEMRSILSGFSV
jgi:hypothetical protein